MPKRKNSAASNVTKKRRIDTAERNEKENHVEAVFIPNPDDSSETNLTKKCQKKNVDFVFHNLFKKLFKLINFAKILSNSLSATQKT